VGQFPGTGVSHHLAPTWFISAAKLGPSRVGGVDPRLGHSSHCPDPGRLLGTDPAKLPRTPFRANLRVADVHVSHLSRENRLLLTRAAEERARSISLQNPQLATCASRRLVPAFAEPDIHSLSRAPKGLHRRLSLCSLPVPKQSEGSLWSLISVAQSATCGTWQPARCVILLCSFPAA
jgi:hypothetical protein